MPSWIRKPTAFALVLAALLLSTRHALAQVERGWNHPWVGYGTDAGSNDWGHSGLSSNGWSAQVHANTRGFANARRVPNSGCSGTAALRVDVALQGQNPNTASGEVELSLINHPPLVGSVRGPGQPLDLDGRLSRVRLWLPPGSAGPASAPNGIQLVFKTRLSDSEYPSLYTVWQNISAAWEGKCLEFTAVVSNTGPAAVRDPGFDARSVALVAVKLGVNAQSTDVVTGNLDVQFFSFDNTVPSIRFDFLESEIESDFGIVRQNGPYEVGRFFVFGDGRASPEFAPDGSVSGLEPSFYTDFDELLRAAQVKGVKVMPVLLDFLWLGQARTVSGVSLRGHSDIIRDPIKRQGFLDRALLPFLQRYGNHPSIHSIDVMNEPEWVMSGVSSTPPPDLDPDYVSVAEMQEFVRQCALYVHQHSQLRVTVGSARRMWLTYWQGLDLDLYQFHWYDHFQATEPFPWGPAPTLGRPVIVGEVPTYGTTISTEAFQEAAEAGGYAGLFWWSFRAGDAFSSFPRGTITVKAPNGGTMWASGSRYTIRWTHNLGAGSLVRLSLDRTGNGTFLETIAASVANTGATSGSYNWLVTAPATSTARVRVTWPGGPIADSSDNYFAIVAPSALEASRGDFDKDGKADVAVFRPSNGAWYIRQSGTLTMSTLTWGGGADKPVPGDYDGDRVVDISVFRPSTGEWFIRQSSTLTMLTLAWGGGADVPVQTDYDGDGKTDIAIFRPSTGTWYIRQSRTLTMVALVWGGGTDIPVQGDYDGDGKADIAVFRASTGEWFVRQSSTFTLVTLIWGGGTDKPVAGDYDGDGRFDIAVFRPSTGEWLVRQSSTLTMVTLVWGGGADVPVPGDYDGDGQFDIAVFRAATGEWFVRQSSTITLLRVVWGGGSDIPILKRP